MPTERISIRSLCPKYASDAGSLNRARACDGEVRNAGWTVAVTGPRDLPLRWSQPLAESRKIGDACGLAQEHRKVVTMAEIMKLVESRETRTDLPNFSPGDTIKVHVKVREGDKERIQIFQGVVISRKGGGTRQMFTVRKISGGIGVERMFPLYSPTIDRIEVERHGRVRRAKLYYLRDLRGKAARIEERRKG
jgi:large subunit ribosomal protein L19